MALAQKRKQDHRKLETNVAWVEKDWQLQRENKKGEMERERKGKENWYWLGKLLGENLVSQITSGGAVSGTLEFARKLSLSCLVEVHINKQLHSLWIYSNLLILLTQISIIYQSTNKISIIYHSTNNWRLNSSLPELL